MTFEPINIFGTKAIFTLEGKKGEMVKIRLRDGIRGFNKVRYYNPRLYSKKSKGQETIHSLVDALKLEYTTQFKIEQLGA